MIKLKPCPFCGSSEISISWHQWGTIDDYDDCKTPHWYYKVECDGCGCASPYDLPSLKEAVKYWNTRTEGLPWAQ